LNVETLFAGTTSSLLGEGQVLDWWQLQVVEKSIQKSKYLYDVLYQLYKNIFESFFREGFTQIMFKTDMTLHCSINCDKSKAISVQSEQIVGTYLINWNKFVKFQLEKLLLWT